MSKLKATPRAIYNGVRDESGEALPASSDQFAIHVPHVFLYTPEGKEEPQYGVGGDLLEHFGRDVFDLRTKYTTHQTVLAHYMNRRVNPMVVQRIRPDDAGPEATVSVSLEIVEDELPEYDRDTDGNLILDEDGNPTDLGTTITGYRGRLVVDEVTEGEFGVRTVTAGSLTGSVEGASTQSEVYPLFDMEVPYFGERGNFNGFRMWAPTEKSLGGTNRHVYDEENAFVYKFQFVKRPSADGTPMVVETMSGSQDIEVCLKEGAVDSRVMRDMFIDDILIDAYRDLDAQPKKYGPFDRLHTYHSEITTVADMIFANEKSHQAGWDTMSAEDARYLINLIGGKNIEGVMYYTYHLDGASNGGAEFTRNSTHYASGGSDGTMTNEAFATKVGDICENYYSQPWNFDDVGYWPQSDIYDTGFPLETKLKMPGVLSNRKDIAVNLCTQDVDMDQNDPATETSIATALRSAVTMYPESEVYGTETIRATITEQSGYLINSPYKGLVPQIIDLANKRAKFMGSPTGRFNRNLGYDVSPNNRTELLKDINNIWMPDNVYDQHWDLGLNWSRTYDRSRNFYPAIQTVNSDNTSVLNSDINMRIAMEGSKVAFRVWRELVGNTKLTADQFLQRSDELIEEEMGENRFDNRVIVEANTYFTDEDTTLGYAWSTEIKLYMNNMRTVGSYTIVSDRRANFEA